MLYGDVNAPLKGLIHRKPPEPPFPGGIPDDSKVVAYEAGSLPSSAREERKEVESDLAADGFGEGGRLKARERNRSRSNASRRSAGRIVLPYSRPGPPGVAAILVRPGTPVESGLDGPEGGLSRGGGVGPYSNLFTLLKVAISH